MKRIFCLLTACTALAIWSTPAIAQEPSGQKQEVEKKTVVAYTGKVLRVDRGDPAMVVVKTEKTDLNVELAPMTFIESSKLTLAPDSDVTVRGYETIRDGKSVFVATEVTSQGNVVKLRDADYKPLWTVKSVAAERPAHVFTYTGKVKTFQTADPAVVIVETDKGPITTELAPMTFIEANKLVLSPNDAVTVRGYETIRDGKTVFVASEVTTPDRRVVRLRSDTLEPVWVKTSPVTNTTTFKEGDLIDVNGTVTAIETTDTPDGRYVTITTEEGTRTIALAPGTYLEKNKYTLAPGDRVRVRGWHANRPGRGLFLASELRLGNNTWRLRNPANGRVLWID
jgi:hypothetical protein